MRWNVITPCLGAACLAASTLLPSASGQIVFEPSVGYPVTAPGFYVGFAVGDIDNDGDPDVLSGSAGIEWRPNTNGVLGAAIPVNSDVSFDQRLVDLDGDGRLDLVNADGAVKVRLGNGNGTFGPAITLNQHPDNHIRTIEVADATGDGIPDVISMNGLILSGDTVQVDVIPGFGNGTFDVPVTIQGPAGTYVAVDAEVGDLNGDGRPDVVLIMNSLFDSTITIYLRSPGGTYTAAGNVPFGAEKAGDVVLHDSDGDGKLDLLVVGNFGCATFHGNGDGTFAPRVVHDTRASQSYVTVADLDGDGLDDITYGSTDAGGVLIARGSASGSYQFDFSLTGNGSYIDLTAVDMDGDGRRDLALYSVFPGTIELMRNHTYGASEPWLDLGFALASTKGVSLPAKPVLYADGTLSPGQPLTVTLNRNGVYQPVAFLAVGGSPIFAPFAGGVFVPTPQILIGPLLGLSVSHFQTVMPAGVPSGTQFWLQAWYVPEMPEIAFSATSAILATTP